METSLLEIKYGMSDASLPMASTDQLQDLNRGERQVLYLSTSLNEEASLSADIVWLIHTNLSLKYVQFFFDYLSTVKDNSHFSSSWRSCLTLITSNYTFLRFLPHFLILWYRWFFGRWYLYSSSKGENSKKYLRQSSQRFSTTSN